MKRFASVWLPYWPAERLARTAPSLDAAAMPLALVEPGAGGLRLRGVNSVAAAMGLGPGMTLADARALKPDLRSRPADAGADADGLRRLAQWCGRYSPWVAVDGADGIVIDLSGAAHLFGGEAALRDDLSRRLRRFGLSAAIAIADSPAASWGMARFGAGGGIVAAGAIRTALAPLAVAALRIAPECVAALDLVGLRRIGDLYAVPRAALARRFGGELLHRLDQALGVAPEPISPLQPVAPWRVRIEFAEPIGTRADIDAACRRLLTGLEPMLERARLGIRRLDLACYRVDGTMRHCAIGTSRPVRAGDHLMRLFAERLGGIDPGFGIELMILSATATSTLVARQNVIAALPADDSDDDLARLVDRLGARLGQANIGRLAPVSSHVPERAARAVAALAPPAGPWPAMPPRPLCLLPRPEPLDEVALSGDPPLAPVGFRWRRVRYRLAQAVGPERIAPEWWRDPAAAGSRDYYRVEDVEGRRFWLYRDTAAGAWYLQGLFA